MTSNVFLQTVQLLSSCDILSGEYMLECNRLVLTPLSILEMIVFTLKVFLLGLRSYAM